MNKRTIGTSYEELAADYLQKQGYEILEKNFRNRFGEIDLIARHGSYLVFVEVKYRSGGGCGSPLDAVNANKQRKISKVAQYYMLTHGYGENTDCRFDVVAITGNKVEVIENAFDAS